MKNYRLIDKYYKKFINNLTKWLPEDIIEVNLSLLNDLGLLNYHPLKRKELELLPTFQILHTKEKITLINPNFIVWIVPTEKNGITTTYSIIARNLPRSARLEMAYITSGVYNTSPLILQILEKLILQIEENDALLQRFEKQ